MTHPAPDLIESIHISIQQQSLIQAGETVLVAVSGGPDSMAMLNILNQIKHAIGFQIHAAHFNHRLRKDAEADEDLVRGFCESRNIPVSCGVWSRDEQIGKGSPEEQARLQRLRFFTDRSKQLKTTKVALGHTRDELAETFLLRLIRGSGLQGLRAMLPMTTVGQLVLVRPFLSTYKKEIINHLESNKIPYRIDPTNHDTDILRNKIRHQLLPLLAADFQPNIKDILSRTAESLAMDFDFLEELLQEQYESHVNDTKEGRIQLDRIRLTQLHPAQRRALYRRSLKMISGHGRQITYHHLLEIDQLAMDSKATGQLHLPGGRLVQRSADSVFLTFQ